MKEGLEEGWARPRPGNAGRNVRLHELYPISARYIMVRLLPWTAALFLLVPLVFGPDLVRIVHRAFGSGLTAANSIAAPAAALPRMHSDFQFMGRFMIAGILVILLLRWLYLRAIIGSYSYTIHNDRFVFSRGVFRRKMTALPLRAMVFYTERSIIDYMFGLSQLVAAAPGQTASMVVRIIGLRTLTAMRLQSHLARLTHENSVGGNQQVIGAGDEPHQPQQRQVRAAAA